LQQLRLQLQQRVHLAAAPPAQHGRQRAGIFTNHLQQQAPQDLVEGLSQTTCA
jgi:hypothetical protein